ncbi:hypothetical protein GGR56DRAFT_675442 [Xylariaceae sp. FL0804]|nr:hypothetical protein GGR56DRAFT_675442 [Xylariaceae sp. FL0804]
MGIQKTRNALRTAKAARRQNMRFSQQAGESVATFNQRMYYRRERGREGWRREARAEEQLLNAMTGNLSLLDRRYSKIRDAIRDERVRERRRLRRRYGTPAELFGSGDELGSRWSSDALQGIGAFQPQPSLPVPATSRGQQTESFNTAPRGQQPESATKSTVSPSLAATATRESAGNQAERQAEPESSGKTAVPVPAESGWETLLTTAMRDNWGPDWDLDDLAPNPAQPDSAPTRVTGLHSLPNELLVEHSERLDAEERIKLAFTFPDLFMSDARINIFDEDVHQFRIGRRSGASLLHVAIERGLHWDHLDRVIDSYAADINRVDPEFDTTLQTAVVARNLPAFRILLRRGADLRSVQSGLFRVVEQDSDELGEKLSIRRARAPRVIRETRELIDSLDLMVYEMVSPDDGFVPPVWNYRARDRNVHTSLMILINCDFGRSAARLLQRIAQRPADDPERTYLLTQLDETLDDVVMNLEWNSTMLIRELVALGATFNYRHVQAAARRGHISTFVELLRLLAVSGQEDVIREFLDKVSFEGDSDTQVELLRVSAVNGREDVIREWLARASVEDDRRAASLTSEDYFDLYFGTGRDNEYSGESD